MLGARFALRLADDNPNDATTSLFVLPIVFVSIELGILPGLACAAIAYALFGAWVAIEDVEMGAVGYVSRILVFFPTALVVGSVASRLRSTLDEAQWMPGKVFDGSAPCGPALVTPDDAGPHDAIEFSLTLNGERMQAGSTSDLVFSVPALVARLSALMTLEPGDVIATGTPSGVGSTRDPRVWLAPGDEIVIESPTLGRLETRIG